MIKLANIEIVALKVGNAPLGFPNPTALREFPYKPAVIFQGQPYVPAGAVGFEELAAPCAPCEAASNPPRLPQSCTKKRPVSAITALL